MSLLGLSRAMWVAAAKPRPVFEPVMIWVWPARDVVGRGGVTKNCE